MVLQYCDTPAGRVMSEYTTTQPEGSGEILCFESFSMAGQAKSLFYYYLFLSDLRN